MVGMDGAINTLPVSGQKVVLGNEKHASVINTPCTLACLAHLFPSHGILYYMSFSFAVSLQSVVLGKITVHRSSCGFSSCRLSRHLHPIFSQVYSVLTQYLRKPSLSIAVQAALPKHVFSPIHHLLTIFPGIVHHPSTHLLLPHCLPHSLLPFLQRLACFGQHVPGLRAHAFLLSTATAHSASSHRPSARGIRRVIGRLLVSWRTV